MAYGLKYQSDFYNRYEKLVSVKIYKRNYGDESTSVRTSQVEINFNYQDNDTPIAGTGAKIVIINEGEFTSLQDLLTSKEKEFFCTIEYNSVLVFQGFSLCDLNEQQFMPKARIAVQFTDYMRRLEGKYLNCLSDIGINTTVFNTIEEALVDIGLDYNLYVNSTLFEENMNQEAQDTFLEQTYVENNMFFTSANDYDDAYTAINKLLLSFGAFLYSHGDKWVIERQEDITRDGDWVMFSSIDSGGDSSEADSIISSLKEEYNKQDGDFDYIEGSQIIEYESGLQMLILNLKDKQLASFVFNNYTLDMLTVNDDFPLYNDSATPLVLRTWYRHENVVPIAVNYAYQDMQTYFEWTYNYDLSPTIFKTQGLYYRFAVQFSPSENTPIVMNITYKMSPIMDYSIVDSFMILFALRIDGGERDGEYIGNIPDVLGNIIPWIVTANGTNEFITEQFTVDPNTGKTFTMSKTLNFTDQLFLSAGGGLGGTYYQLWEQLGSPANQEFTIMFFPMYYFKPLYVSVVSHNYIGDIEVTITQPEVLNKLTYYLNEDFIKTKSIDIDFFDLDNVNFSNGFMIGDNGETKTNVWISEDSPSSIPLMDIYAKNKFRNYSRTIHKLKANISHDGYMKPFSILTDDNIVDDSSANINFILQNYTWDLYAGIYTIEAEEYTDEEVLLDITNSPIPSEEIEVPSDLALSQDGIDDPVDVSWSAVTGATGYLLRRKPYYNGVTWDDFWSSVYYGSDLSYEDDIIANEGEIPDSTTVTYQVSAYTDVGWGAWSAEEEIEFSSSY